MKFTDFEIELKIRQPTYEQINEDYIAYSFTKF